jgi:tetratricopeptide (TPR) repeat protein
MATKSVSSGTLISSIIAAFLVGYVVSAFVGGFRFDRGFAGAGKAQAGGTLFQESPPSEDYLSVLEERVSGDPGNEELWTELGNAYFDSDQYRSAVEAYRRSLEIDSRNADVWTDMGIMYRRLGEYSAALAAFEEAISVNPAHQAARFNRGIVLYYDLGDRVAAFESWDELARMNPNFRVPDGRTVVQMLGDLR